MSHFYLLLKIRLDVYKRQVSLSKEGAVILPAMPGFYSDRDVYKRQTIYNKDGSLAVTKNVTFNINGVFYIRTTDSNGVVSLAINLRPGEDVYKRQVFY